MALRKSKSGRAKQGFSHYRKVSTMTVSTVLGSWVSDVATKRTYRVLPSGERTSPKRKYGVAHLDSMTDDLLNRSDLAGSGEARDVLEAHYGTDTRIAGTGTLVTTENADGWTESPREADYAPGDIADVTSNYAECDWAPAVIGKHSPRTSPFEAVGGNYVLDKIADYDHADLGRRAKDGRVFMQMGGFTLTVYTSPSPQAACGCGARLYWMGFAGDAEDYTVAIVKHMQRHYANKVAGQEVPVVPAQADEYVTQ